MSSKFIEILQQIVGLTSPEETQGLSLMRGTYLPYSVPLSPSVLYLAESTTI
jgi:hypothetical protein